MGLNKAGWRTHFANQPKSDFQKQQEEIGARNKKDYLQNMAHSRGEKCFFPDCEQCYPLNN